jgi:hypothetical protein
MHIETNTSHETGQLIGPAKITGSVPFQIDPSDLRRIGMNVLIYGLGLVSAWLTSTVLPQVDQHNTTGLILAIVIGSVVDFIRKFSTSTIAAKPESPTIPLAAQVLASETPKI